MTTTPQNRVQRGVPTGGEYAATVHAEPGITLDQPAPAGLEGWPASLPQPVVDVRFDDAGATVVALRVGEDFINVWADNESTGRLDSDAIGFEDVDQDTLDAAHEAAHKVYRKIAPAIEEESRAAVQRAKARIIAKATGTVRPATDGELDAIIESNAKVISTAGRDLEMASAALAARKVKAAHPTAAFMGIIVEGTDEGEYVEGVSVYDADRKELGSYHYGWEDENDAPEGVEAAELVKSLNPHAATSYWSSDLAVGSYGDDMWLIDVDRAAAWTPGGAR